MIDMLALLSLAEKLGGRADKSDGYDEVVIGFAHHARLSVQGKGSPANYCGCRVSADIAVPDGIGVFRHSGRVIGAIDFAAKRTLFLNNPTEWFQIEEKPK